MTQSERAKELKLILETTLMPLIDANYVLLDVPYYPNLGDMIIWEGTTAFLKKLPYKCLYETGIYNYDGRRFSKDTIILFHGGGNFGDLYEGHNEFRRMIIEKYPDNKIIILPQAVYYQGKEKLIQDGEFFSKFQNVLICVRDEPSFEIIKNNFTNTVLLLPDMTFLMNIKKYKKEQNKGTSLYVMRSGAEIKIYSRPSFIPENADCFEWEAISVVPIYRIFCRIVRMISVAKLDKIRLTKKIVNKFKDLYWQRILKPRYVKSAVKILDQYECIYSTRLHAAILSVLLEKEIFLMDNSYGKNLACYNTWFKNIDNFEFKQELE